MLERANKARTKSFDWHAM